MTRTACCLFLALQLCSAATALAGDVTLRKSLEVPVGRAERIEIVNRLGSVKIVARDGARLRVSAIKRAPNPILAERLTVNLERSPRSPDTWSASTYVRRLSPQQSATWHRQAVRIHRLLLGSLERQRVRMRSPRLRRALARQIAAVRVQLEQLGRTGEQVQSVPLTRGRLDLELRVPRRMAVSARTFKHDIEVQGMQGGSELLSEEGAVRVRDVAGSVATTTQRGQQRLEQIRGPLRVRGSSSDVVLRRISGPVEVALVSGQIDARDLSHRSARLRSILGSIRLGGALPAGGALYLLSRDGDIELLLAADASCRVRGRVPRVVRGARVRPRRLSHRRGRVELQIGRGRGARIEVRTRTGALRLVAEP